MIRLLAIAAALGLAGCTATGPAVSHGPDHPAAAEAPAASHHAHADSLPQAPAVYAPSGVPAGAHADHSDHLSPSPQGDRSQANHRQHSAGHTASGDGCPMGCCEDGACTMPCCQKDGAAGEGHEGHNHAAHGRHAQGEEGCQMACCQEGGSCRHGDGHGGHAAHGQSPAAVDLSRPATAHAHASDPVTLSADEQAALRVALEAYLAIADRLADDSVAGVADHARALDAALATLAEGHGFHGLRTSIDAAREHATHLGHAGALPDVRDAFGQMSPAFARLVEAAGAPEGMPVTRYVCGMADAPEGGVWIQAEGAPRNPYFGSAMLRCHRSQQAL